jgi:hypothetical protein
MTRVGDPIPMLVPVPIEGLRHYVYGALQTEVEKYGADVIYSKTLCGRACGLDLVAQRSRTNGLPECRSCRAEDERRFPDGFNRRVLR